MKTLKTLTIAAAVAALTLSAEDSVADTKDVVVDKNDNIVVNTWGNCVRTKWDSSSDACGNEPVAPVKMPAKKLDQLSREDKTVYFDFDKSHLTDKARMKLDTLSNIINSSKQVVRANIVGYADRMGTNDYNMNLSKSRALAVHNYLQGKGLDSRVAKLRALGEESASATCDNNQGRSALIKCLAPDRRVEIELDYYK